MSTISKNNLQFLKDLSRNNNRDWFQEHKGEYLSQHQNTMQILQQHGVEPLGNFSSERVSLLQLQGLQGYEYWITGDNFYAITRYNHSPKYAMAIFQLAWEIKRRKLNSAK